MRQSYAGHATRGNMTDFKYMAEAVQPTGSGGGADNSEQNGDMLMKMKAT